jgi:predicted ArsR family transcriptional regulator
MNAITPKTAQARAMNDDLWPTKRNQALKMLLRPEGASIAQLAEGVGCSANAARLHVSGLRKAGVNVQVLDYVHTATFGTKGSFFVFHVPMKARGE